MIFFILHKFEVWFVSPAAVLAAGAVLPVPEKVRACMERENRPHHHRTVRSALWAWSDGCVEVSAPTAQQHHH